MEISRITDSSIKIKTKEATVLVDPTTKTDGEIVLLTSPGDYTIPEDAKLVIEGPGEYEVNGIHVTGELNPTGLTFTLFDDQFRILLTNVTGVQKLKEEEGYDALILKVNGTVDDTIMSMSAAETLIIYGDETQMKLPDQEIKRLPKVNLKKKDEVKGFAIYLGASSS